MEILERKDTNIVCFKAQIPIYEYLLDDGRVVFCCDLVECPIWGKKCDIYRDLAEGAVSK